MRYSRMLSKQPKKKRGYANLILVAVIIGITVYFVVAGAAGGWLAENVINPVFNNDPNAEAATQSPSTTVLTPPADTEAVMPGTVQPVNLPETSEGNRKEEQIAVSSLTLYTLQAGAFADEANAKTAAAEIIARGGAGFVAYDGNLYRALIAGYINEPDAQSVKGELEQQGIVSTVFKLESGALEFKVGAEQKQIDAIKACFTLVSDTVSTLQQIIFDADKGQNVDERIGELKTNAQTVSENLKSVITTDTEATKRIGTYMDSFCETLNNIPASKDVTPVAFSTALKYNIICIVVDYSTFLDELSS